jgi:hypothetical protein
VTERWSEVRHEMRDERREKREMERLGSSR